MLNEVRADYVRTAMAKGVSEEGILFKHVLKNAMIPILTITVLSIPFLITGSLLLEIYFGIPGMGNLMINAINSADYPVIRTLVYVYSLLYIAGSILTDISYTLVDPRVTFE
jgi:peptide/nickel transport system permease protein